MKKREILFTLESRATYGYSKNVIKAMKDFPNLSFKTLLTGSHLSSKFGSSINEIKNDKISIDEKVKFEITKKNPLWSYNMGIAISKFSKIIHKIKPDIVLIFGDRIESLSVCISAVYMNFPVAHVQAGDKSGHIDDAARYAIAKLSHIHFASCEDSKKRLENLGEQRFRIFDTGAPQLDNINEDSEKCKFESLSIKKIVSKDFILVIFHPIMTEIDLVGEYMNNILKNCFALDLNVICIFPNTDLGSDEILNVINSFKLKKLKVIRNIRRELFLNLLKNCKFLIGNSSAGILEAPSFKKPVINVGIRQRGRPQSKNIINCGYSYNSIKQAIKKVLNQKFRDSCLNVVNLYGDGKSGKRICRILEKIPLDKKLLDKKTVY